MTEFAEATLGNTVNNKGREGFLKYDRKVLRFTCYWDDREALYGDMQKFKLHYFLSDDTIEVLQVYSTNCGRDPYPLLLKRARMPRDLEDETAGTYHWSDLAIGAVVNVYKRRLQIVDADEFTRSWMANEGMGLAEPMVPPEEEPPAFDRILPPHNGYGTEEDSLTSCIGSLVQTAPKKIPGTDRTLRYLARMKNPGPEDEGREFVIQYFLIDNTMAIREPPQRNSGIVGGNFLKRGTSQVKDDIGNPILQFHFYIGAEIPANGCTFVITDSDDSTLKHMENEPDVFPHSDYNGIISRLARSISPEDMPSFEAQAREMAPGGMLNLEGLQDLLAQNDISVPDQVPITIMRRIGGSTFEVPVEELLSQMK